ncbi:MAG: BlaI/MecI/CopY family transcriptional regulator [Sedimentisphaerales bacterium]|nr:BlaI/MecI/CopY family transcriptional regulator [Sedimentisphaerales bacterium]
MSTFTAGESEIMKILWEHGEQKPSEIQSKYPREIRNAALRFQLKVLLEKGHVTRSKVGKAYYYKAATAQKGAFREMARRMAQIYCRGSAAGLIAELIKNEKLNESEISELKKLAESKHAGGK